MSGTPLVQVGALDKEFTTLGAARKLSIGSSLSARLDGVVPFGPFLRGRELAHRTILVPDFVPTKSRPCHRTIGEPTVNGLRDMRRGFHEGDFFAFSIRGSCGNGDRLW